MKNIFLKNYQKIREQYGSIIDALQITSEVLGIKFILIGAQSRNVWSSHLNRDKRETRDIDYSVQLRDYSEWQTMREYLVDNFGVVPDSKKPYRFKLNNQEFDILPFGNFIVNDEIILDDKLRPFSVMGFQDIADKGAIELGDNWIVTLPGLCVLKLISYSEKPDERSRDFDDFLFLLFNLTDIYGDSTYDDEDFLNQMGNGIDIEISSAHKLGNEMSDIIQQNNLIRKKILAVLNKELYGLHTDEIIAEYRNGKSNSQELTKFRLLVELIQTIDIVS